MAGAVTTVEKKSYDNGKERIEEYIFTWVADDTDGSINSKQTDKIVVGWVFQGETNPGSPAPTDDYDVTITNEAGVDVFGGELANRDTANSEQAVPKIGAAYGERWVNTKLTFNASGSIVNDAQGVCKIWVRNAHMQRDL
jgi:hypothetical protein